MGRIKEFLFQNQNTRQKVVKNIFWLGFGQITSRLIRASIVIYAARILGAAGYGVFSYALGLIGFFTIFADIGLIQILTREVARKPDKALNYFSTVFLIKTFLISGTVLVLIFITPYFSKIEEAKALIPIFALLIIFNGIRDFSVAFFRAKEKMELETFVVIVTNVAIALFGFSILYFFVTPIAFTISYVASAGVGALLSIIILKNEFLKITKYFDKKLLRPILTSAWPLAFSGIFGVFMLNTDIVMLGFWRTAEEIGFYSAAQKIIQLVYTVPSILVISTFPVISRFVGKQEVQKVKDLMEKTSSVLLLIAIPVAVGGIILAQPIIQFVYGSTFLPAVLVFQVLILAIIFNFPGGPVGNLILAYDQQKKAIKYLALGAVVNILLNIVLIPLYGILGAAITTLTVQILFITLLQFLAKKINNFYVLRYLKKIIFAAIIMGIGTFIFNKIGLHILFNITISGMIYFSLLLLLKEVAIKEIKIVVRSIKK